VVLVVTGMSCRHCVRHVTACLRDVPGVETVEADRVSRQVRLRGRFALPDVLSALARAGNRARVLDDSTAGSPREALQPRSRTSTLEEEER
jgi:copper chaperone CopZ